MTKKQFLDILGSRLRQQFSQDEVMKQIIYYDNYLEERMAQGTTEEEAVAELGDPLLIAKTLMDTSGEAGNDRQEHIDPDDSFSRQEGTEKSGGFFDGIIRHKNLIITIVAAVLILMVVFKVSAVVIRILAPVVLPVLLVIVIVRMIKHTRND